jgi:hypothetical protein
MTGGRCTLVVMRAVFAAVAVVVLCAFAPQAALAASGPPAGVHVDPGSPAGKQYSIPIPSARGEASGQSAGSGSGDPPSFGAGVTPSAAGTAASTKGHGSRSSALSSRSVRTRPRHHGSSAALTTASSTHPATAADRVGGNSWLPLVGGGALVLLLGCGGGLALRRRM